MERVKNLIKKLELGILVASLFSGSVMAATDLKFALDWKFEGPAAPFFTGLERGYYAASGLDVTIDSGRGSLDAIPKVASGTYPIGIADINSLIKLRWPEVELNHRHTDFQSALSYFIEFYWVI